MTDNKIEQLVSNGKTITVDDVDFEVTPLTVKQFLHAQVIGENQDQGQALLQMLTDSLSEEDISKQDLQDAPAKLIKPLQDAVTEVNDFEDFFDEDEQQEALEKLQ